MVESSLASLDDMIVFFRSLHMLPDDRQTQVRAERRAYHDVFRGLVEEGMAAGVFRTEVSADIIVHYFLSAVNQLGSWFHPEGALTAREVGRAVRGVAAGRVAHLAGRHQQAGLRPAHGLAASS